MRTKAKKGISSEARAKAFLKQVNVKKERNLTKAYMALKGSQRKRSQ